MWRLCVTVLFPAPTHLDVIIASKIDQEVNNRLNNYKDIHFFVVSLQPIYGHFSFFLNIGAVVKKLIVTGKVNLKNYFLFLSIYKMLF